MVVLKLSSEKIKKFKKIKFSLKTGERLELQRIKFGLSARALAKKIDSSHTVIRKWERGKVSPNIVALYQLAEFYNISVDYLLGRTDNPEVNK